MLHVNASVDAEVEPKVIFELVSDLGTYPRWLDIVGRAEPVRGESASESPAKDGAGQDGAIQDGAIQDGAGQGDDGGQPHSVEPAWLVDLRAQMGPLRRSKRLRMVRTVCEPLRVARFERRELDGRTHSDWVLSAAIDEIDTGVRLTMDLRYGGSLWIPALDRILREEIRRSSARLVEMVQ